MEIDITAPYQIAGKKATKFVVRSLGYAEMSRIATSAGREAKPGEANALVRARSIMARTKVLTEDGKSHDIEPLMLHTLPRPVAKPLLNYINTEGDIPDDATEEEKARIIATGPSIILDGDGLSEPVLFKLGTPISGTTGTSDKAITELEFLAKTYGDVEMVLAGTNDMEKTVALIKYVAKPAGMLALPSWGVDAIDIRDGFFIQNEILPRFLE